MAWRYTKEARETAAKPLTGHKGRVIFGAKYNCECGWGSCIYFGKGAQGQAAAEFREHKLNCLDEARLLADANSHYSQAQLEEIEDWMHDE